MTDLLWLAGDLWNQHLWWQWASYLTLGLLTFVWGARWWTTRQYHRQGQDLVTDGLQAVNQHQKKRTIFLQAPSYHWGPLNHLYNAYRLSQLSIPWSQIWQISLVLSFFVMGLVWWQTKSAPFTLSVPIFVFGMSSLLIYLKSLDQRQRLVEQIPLFLQALSNSLQAGYTLPMALEFIADEIEAPLQHEIKTINHQLNLQVPLATALTEFARKVKNPEVDFFVESTLIQLKTGGNLVKLFNKIAYLIEEKLKLKRDVKSFTSQGKLSGILIAALWPLSVMAFSWLSPTHTEVLFNTPSGQFMLTISLLLELLGFFFIWKIISVKL